MRLGRPTPPLTLTDDERERLGQWARRPKTAQALAQRARMVLECSKGKTNTAVAAELRVSKATVGKWRTRFLESRLDGLVDEPRPGRPRTVTDADVERVVTLTMETTPKDATHWSTRSMEARSGLSRRRSATLWACTSTRLTPKPFVWIKTADQILANVARFCQRTSGTGR